MCAPGKAALHNHGMWRPSTVTSFPRKGGSDRQGDIPMAEQPKTPAFDPD
ncbi:hypothetical protein MACH21_05370 [Roseicyclus marinus]|uniref:Uncharacterized protein n=1 Tax=Roseicyclus marinus TaxID=2161673 RepID=A0AA48KJR7_9RHOB|nr:hypothetical protein MACH21_05370 [Roseicyclus marinus]